MKRINKNICYTTEEKTDLMEYTHIFEKYRFSTDKAEKFGFKEKSGQYVYKTEEYGGVYLVFTVDPAKKTFSVHAVDGEFDEIYRMFEVGGSSSFANGLREKANEIADRIISECFEDKQTRGRVFSYVYEKYGTTPDYPFEDDDDTAVLRCENGKWYALVMSLTYRQLGIDSDEAVDVMNIKLPPEKIQTLPDGKYYFKCYHMNKKYWISVALLDNIDFEKLSRLIDESHDIVEKKATKCPKKDKKVQNKN